MSAALAAFIFILAGAAVALSSTRIVRYGEVVAERTRLGQLWVGATMIAAVTSFPELATDITAAVIGAPDLAAGDLFGSSLANMLIFAALSIWFARLWRGHSISTVEWITWAVALLVTTEAMLFILFDMGPQILAVGSGGILITVSYLVGARIIFQRSAASGQEMFMEGQAAAVVAGDHPARPVLPILSLQQALVRFAGWSAVVLIAAPLLAGAAEELAEVTGLGDTFFGVIGLAVITSLPELVASIAAFRRGLPSMVLGNLLGSNGLNMLIILAVDIFFTEGPFLQSIIETHALAALEGIVMMVAVMGGVLLLSRSREALGRAVLGAAALFYVASMLSIYARTA
ncbi:MAG: hypothetical protein O7D33_06215 [Chloroflexi bacterium]|nr:hypothetical protein [Chloroflexota bacterium]